MARCSGTALCLFMSCCSTAVALSRLDLKSAADGAYPNPVIATGADIIIETRADMMVRHMLEQRNLLQHKPRTADDQVPVPVQVPQVFIPATTGVSAVPGVTTVASAASGVPQGAATVIGVPSYPVTQPVVGVPSYPVTLPTDQSVQQAAAVPSYPVASSPAPVPLTYRPVAVATAASAPAVSVLGGGTSYEPVKFVKDKAVTMCCCAKCGSTAVYDFIYLAEFGTAWPYQGTAPYIQEILSDRWAGKWAVADQTQTSSLLEKSKFSIALVRDPIERLVSAWRSKISCPHDFNGKSVSEGDSPEEKERKTQGLLTLQGKGRTGGCLEFGDFLSVLRDIQWQNKTLQLDDHFMPQSQYCFAHSKPDEWTQVVSIAEPGSLAKLAAALGTEENTNTTEAPAKTHGTGYHKPLLLAAPAYKLLHTITADDYAMFGQHLPKEHSKTNPPPQLKAKPSPLGGELLAKNVKGGENVSKAKGGEAKAGKAAPKVASVSNAKPAPKTGNAATPAAKSAPVQKPQ